eukprot:g1128.t1
MKVLLFLGFLSLLLSSFVNAKVVTVNHHDHALEMSQNREIASSKSKASSNGSPEGFNQKRNPKYPEPHKPSFENMIKDVALDPNSEGTIHTAKNLYNLLLNAHRASVKEEGKKKDQHNTMVSSGCTFAADGNHFECACQNLIHDSHCLRCNTSHCHECLSPASYKELGLQEYFFLLPNATKCVRASECPNNTFPNRNTGQCETKKIEDADQGNDGNALKKGLSKKCQDIHRQCRALISKHPLEYMFEISPVCLCRRRTRREKVQVLNKNCSYAHGVCQQQVSSSVVVSDSSDIFTTTKTTVGSPDHEQGKKQEVSCGLCSCVGEFSGKYCQICSRQEDYIKHRKSVATPTNTELSNALCGPHGSGTWNPSTCSCSCAEHFTLNTTTGMCECSDSEVLKDRCPTNISSVWNPKHCRCDCPPPLVPFSHHQKGDDKSLLTLSSPDPSIVKSKSILVRGTIGTEEYYGWQGRMCQECHAPKTAENIFHLCGNYAVFDMKRCECGEQTTNNCVLSQNKTCANGGVINNRTCQCECNGDPPPNPSSNFINDDNSNTRNKDTTVVLHNENQTYNENRTYWSPLDDCRTCLLVPGMCRDGRFANRTSCKCESLCSKKQRDLALTGGCQKAIAGSYFDHSFCACRCNISKDEKSQKACLNSLKSRQNGIASNFPLNGSSMDTWQGVVKASGKYYITLSDSEPALQLVFDVEEQQKTKDAVVLGKSVAPTTTNRLKKNTWMRIAQIQNTTNIYPDLFMQGLNPGFETPNSNPLSTDMTMPTLFNFRNFNSRMQDAVVNRSSLSYILPCSLFNDWRSNFIVRLKMGNFTDYFTVRKRSSSERDGNSLCGMLTRPQNFLWRMDTCLINDDKLDQGKNKKKEELKLTATTSTHSSSDDTADNNRGLLLNDDALLSHNSERGIKVNNGRAKQKLILPKEKQKRHSNNNNEHDAYLSCFIQPEYFALAGRLETRGGSEPNFVNKTYAKNPNFTKLNEAIRNRMYIPFWIGPKHKYQQGGCCGQNKELSMSYTMDIRRFQ